MIGEATSYNMQTQGLTEKVNKVEGANLQGKKNQDGGVSEAYAQGKTHS